MALFGAGLAAAAFILHASARRFETIQHGVSARAIVQRAYSERSYARSIWVGTALTRDFLDVAYRTPDGARRVSKTRVGSSREFHEGQVLTVHYLPDQPECAILDDDRGFMRRQQFMAAAVVALAWLLAGWIAYHFNYKKRFLVRWGTVVRAVVAKIEYRSPSNRRVCTLSWERDGRRVEMTTDFLPRPEFVRVGEVVSAFVHPRFPREIVVYRAAPWIVLGPGTAPPSDSSSS